MPLHDWTRVSAGLFHHFRQDWSIEIARTLNRGQLPQGVSALVEQRSGPLETDVLAIEGRSAQVSAGDEQTGAIATQPPPSAQIIRRSTKELYADRANRVVLKHHLGRIIAVIEIVSPGNKSSRSALREFVEKTMEFLKSGVHVLVVDLFPPSPRDPAGIHKLIWDEIEEEDFSFPPGKDRILASYKTDSERVAFLEPIAVGDALPPMTLFLSNRYHIQVPLEPTYCATWDASPAEFRRAVETGELPEGAE
jgi:hypothetical protein